MAQYNIDESDLFNKMDELLINQDNDTLNIVRNEC